MTELEIFKLCREIDFPQTELSKSSIINNFNNLRLNENLSKTSNTCMQLIQHYHPSIWKANVKNHLSPFDAWYDDLLLFKCIINRLKYKGSNLSPKDIRAGFSISKIAPKVSVFRPAYAKYLIKKYLNDYNQIFDPFSGYSGRLLGAVSLEKEYIGQDINPTTIKEANNLISDLLLKKCKVSLKNSICSKGEYDCLFTCPPYADKENWNQNIEVLSSDEWINICLNNYKCKTYLFVVDKTEKFKEFIVEELENKSYMTNSKEYVIKIER